MVDEAIPHIVFLIIGHQGGMGRGSRWAVAGRDSWWGVWYIQGPSCFAFVALVVPLALRRAPPSVVWPSCRLLVGAAVLAMPVAVVVVSFVF